MHFSHTMSLTPQKISKTTNAEELERSGFFPKDERDLGKPSDTLRRQRLNSIFSGLQEEKPPSTLTAIAMLVGREWTHIKRNKAVTVARIIQTSVLSAMIGTIFFQVGSAPNNSMTNIQSHFGALVMASTMIMMGPAQAA